MKSEAEKRMEQIEEQLDRLRPRLASKPAGRYASEGARKYQRRRLSELVAALEEELSMLADPGEYEVLPAATVADELGLTLKQVRGLIKSGEIEASGKAGHERVGRTEMERIATLGAAELLRLGRQESAEIFEEAVPRLQACDLEFSERAYRRLEARGVWRVPYGPAFIFCLDIAKGDSEGARGTIRLIQGHEGPSERAAIMAHARRLVGGMRFRSDGAQAFCERLLAGVADTTIQEGWHQALSEHQHEDEEQRLQTKAAYLAAVVQLELRRRGLSLKECKAEADEPGDDLNLLLRSAVYTALLAEETCHESEASRAYVRSVNRLIPTSHQPAILLKLIDTSDGTEDSS